VWSGNSKAGGYYGLARLATRSERYDDALAFCRQSLLACPTNQDVLSLETLLLHLTGRRSQALQQIEKLLGDYPLNPTLWWLNATISEAEADTARWFAVCQSRDINALLTAGLLLSWGMAARAKAVLTALNCQKTLPLYLQASLAEGNERIALINRAREVFPDFVRFPICWWKWLRWRRYPSAILLSICSPVSTIAGVIMRKRRSYGIAALKWLLILPMPGEGWRFMHGINRVMPTWRQRIWRKPAPDSRRMRVCFLNATCWIS
jgi:tetratricopeptide (TPR) repeat protein